MTKIGLMSGALSRRAVFAVLVLTTLACTSRGVEGESGPPSVEPVSEQALLIDHVAPHRDVVGPAPSAFEWTAAKGADEYAIGLWNESDTIVWRQAGIREPSVALPDEVELEPGTYFWSVVGLREGRPVAQSGLSAFVVMAPK